MKRILKRNIKVILKQVKLYLIFIKYSINN